jgi:uncharacterized surface protein with fasciclin (FAS1) repeats
MYPSKNIIENAVNSKDHNISSSSKSSWFRNFKEKDLYCFAPTNAAFAKLPMGTVETLLKPENLKMLQTILTYHVVQENERC